MPVKVTDNGYTLRVKQLQKMQAASLSVGVHGEEGGAKHGADGVTIAQIAEAHELGLGVPRRSFVRSWFEVNRARNVNILVKSLQRVASGKATYPEALHGAGSVFVADMRLRIARGMIQPGLDERTIRLKGSTVPLLDTGQLASSIRYSFEGPALPKAKGNSPVSAGVGKGAREKAAKARVRAKRTARFGGVEQEREFDTYIAGIRREKAAKKAARAKARKAKATKPKRAPKRKRSA